LDKLDDYRCEGHYMKRLKKCKFDNRIESLEKTIVYVSKKQRYKNPSKIQNIHFLSIHEKEEMSYAERIERYWLNINDKRSFRLKKNDRIEEKMKQLENKIDKFKIWKEKFSNMKLISNI
jgi:thiamine kinase-like enzyme